MSSMATSFKSQIAQYSVAQIRESILCPDRVIYMWKVGKSKPRPWAQRLILRALASSKSKTP